MIEPLMATMAEADDGTVWLAGLEEMMSFRPDLLLDDNQESTIVVAPRPWWMQWWAWLACLLLLGLAVLASFAYGYLEGRVTGFRRGVRAAREEADEVAFGCGRVN